MSYSYSVSPQVCSAVNHFDGELTCLSEAVLCPEVPDDGGEGGGGELHALALVAAEEAGQVVAPLVLLHVALSGLGYLRRSSTFESN